MNAAYSEMQDLNLLVLYKISTGPVYLSIQF